MAIERKKLIEMTLAVVLVTVFIGIIVKTILDVRAPRSGTAPSPATAAALPAVPPAPAGTSAAIGTTAERRALMESRRQQLQWDADPFLIRAQRYIPPQTEGPEQPTRAPLPNLKLTGIVYIGPAEQNLALINDQLFKVDQEVAGAILREIRPDGVLFEYQQQPYFVKLWEELTPQPIP